MPKIHHAADPNGDAEQVRLPRPVRYTAGARWYDVLSGERLIYRAGRVVGIDELRPRRGDRVLDVGCGTGLNFPLLFDAIGDDGAVVGIDASGPMLAQARRRVFAHGWAAVTLVKADGAHLDTALTTASITGEFDAVLFTYSLSIIAEWRAAFRQALARVRPGGRVVVVDMGRPVGQWRVLTPLARLACFTGGADIDRAPWTAVAQRTEAAVERVVRSGHVHIAAGTRR